MFFIGVDLGQRRDHTAVAVVERIAGESRTFDPVAWRTRAEALPDEWVVRHLERMPLGTPYTEVTARIVALARHPRIAGRVPTGGGRYGSGNAGGGYVAGGAAGMRDRGGVDHGRAGGAVRWRGLACAETGSAGAAAGAAGNETAADRADRMREAGTLVRELVSMRVGKASERTVEDGRGGRGGTRRPGAGGGAGGMGGTGRRRRGNSRGGCREYGSVLIGHYREYRLPRKTPGCATINWERSHDAKRTAGAIGAAAATPLLKAAPSKRRRSRRFPSPSAPPTTRTSPPS